MNYGFVKVAAAVPHVKVADCKFNVERIESQIAIAEGKGVQIIVFPEMSITGYTCGDLFGQQILLEEAEMGLMQILNNTRQLDIISIVGMPVVVNSTVINAAVVIQKGKVLGVAAKTYLPNYKEFYEKRWFAGADQRFSDTIRYDEIFYDEGASLNGERTFPFTPNLIIEGRNGIRLACEICEDLWVNIPPSSFHASAGANVIANLSASNDVVTKPEYRRDLVRMQSGTNMCAYVYCSSGSGESTTDLIFSGHNIIAANGTILADSNKEATEALIDLERINNDRIKNNSISYAAARYSQMA